MSHVLRVAVVAAVVAAYADPAVAGGSGTFVSDPSTDDGEPLYVAEYRAEATFAVGFDVGLGAIGSTCGSCEQTLGGLAVVAYGGAMVTRRIAALIDVQSVLHLLPSESADTRGLLSNTLATASGRFWFTPTFWAQTGAGLGVFNVAGGGDDAGTELGPGFSLAIGGEVDHHPDRGIDLAGRFGLALYDDDDGDTSAVYNVSATVGWHWY